MGYSGTMVDLLWQYWGLSGVLLLVHQSVLCSMRTSSAITRTNTHQTSTRSTNTQHQTVSSCHTAWSMFTFLYSITLPPIPYPYFTLPVHVIHGPHLWPKLRPKGRSVPIFSIGASWSLRWLHWARVGDCFLSPLTFSIVHDLKASWCHHTQLTHIYCAPCDAFSIQYVHQQNGQDMLKYSSNFDQSDHQLQWTTQSNKHTEWIPSTYQ